MNYPINSAGVALLKELEAFIGRAYPDPASPMGRALRKAGLWRAVVYRGQPIPEQYLQLDGAPWTLGYGFTQGVQPGDVITQAEAEARLAQELRTGYVEPLLRACTVKPNANQLAAMACLAWNIGIGGFLKSSVLKAHNRGDFDAAARAFALWNKARGQVEPALETRRRREATLYSTPDVLMASEPMPQTVDAETPMTRSRIATAGTATAAVSGVSVVAQLASEVRSIKDSIGDMLPIVLLIAALAALGFGAWTVWERIKQRRGGWA